MNRFVVERSPRLRRSLRFQLRVLPNEVHFYLLNEMNTPEDWKNYGDAYPHLTTDDYFWKKLIVKFPTLTIRKCQMIKWNTALQNVDFNFTLVYACETNNIQLFKQVLKYGGNIYQRYKKTFLFFIMVCQKRFDMVQLLLNKGFDINTVNKDQTVLMFCVSNNDIEGAQFLLENGADVNFVVSNVFYYSFSALSTFCSKYFEYQNDDMLKMLTDYGADYNLKSAYKKVALHVLIDGLSLYTSSHRPLNVSFIKKMFILFIQKTDMTIVNKKNRTFLHELCIEYLNNDRMEIFIDLFKFLIRTFIKAGIPIDVQDNNKYTAYDYLGEARETLFANF